MAGRLVVKKCTPQWLDRVLAGQKPWEIRRADDWRWRAGDWLVLGRYVACRPGWGALAWGPDAVLVRVVEVLRDVPGLQRGYRLLRITDPVAVLQAPPGVRMGRSDAAVRYHWRLAAEAAMGWSGDWDETNAPAPGPEEEDG